MELSEIRYFLAVSQTLNFTRAAERCHVSQPALTRAIRKMEDELGGLLFSRERNNTHLTELGELVLPHLTEVIERTGTVEKTAASFLKLEQAHLAVGVMSTIAPLQFIQFLAGFRQQNPGIEVTLKEASPTHLCDSLTQGGLDVALMARLDGFPAPMVPVPLYTERFVIACSTGHRFAERGEISIPDLDGEFYFPRMNCELSSRLTEVCREQNVNLVKSFRSEREDWILSLVAEGLGICFLPEFSTSFPGVVGCPVSGPRIERMVCLVTVAGRRASPPVRAFVTAIRRYPWSGRQAVAD